MIINQKQIETTVYCQCEKTTTRHPLVKVLYLSTSVGALLYRHWFYLILVQKLVVMNLILFTQRRDSCRSLWSPPALMGPQFGSVSSIIPTFLNFLDRGLCM